MSPPTAGRRAERLAAAAFIVAVVAALGLVVVYWTHGRGQPQLEGILLAVVTGGIGVGIVIWAKHFMPHGPFTEPRGTISSSEEERAAFVEDFERGGERCLGAASSPPGRRRRGARPRHAAADPLARTATRSRPQADRLPRRRPPGDRGRPAGRPPPPSPSAACSPCTPRTTRRRATRRRCSSTSIRAPTSRALDGPIGRRATSSPTRSCAPTWAARSGSTRRRKASCSARATSRPSTCSTVRGRSSARDPLAAATTDRRRRRGLPRGQG